MQQHDSVLEAHQKENELLQEKLHEIKAEDNKTREKLKQASSVCIFG